MGGGSVAEQFLVWGVANQIATALLGPYFTELTELINSRTPVNPIAPADLADMVVKNIFTEPEAAVEARKSGVPTDDFHKLVLNTGEPLGLEQGLEAWRRGFMPFDDQGVGIPSVDRLIKESRLYDHWAPIVKALGDIPISIGEAVDAVLRGQIDPVRGETEAHASGLSADRFQILLSTAGRPPAPVEAAKLVHRGLIPAAGTGPDALTFQQAIYEGDSKNKWWQLLLAGEQYLPPPRTITALLKTGSLTVEQAQKYFQDAGMTPELAAAYVHNAKGEKLAGTRQLAETAVLTLYDARAIDQPTALAHLAALGYDQADTDLIVGLTDLQREVRAVNSAITRVGTLYVNHKITRQAAVAGLRALETNQAHADSLIAEWDTTVALNVRQLTPPQILKAYKLGNLTEAEVLVELQAIGYTHRDAQLLAWNELDTGNQTLPAQGPGGPGTVP